MDRVSDPLARPAPDGVRAEFVSDERLTRYHEYTRKHGVNWVLYILARIFMTPFSLVYFRYQREGRENGKLGGGLIVASNHRSFFDPFLIGGSLPWRRPMNYVAKVELFENPVQAWILSRLGAFPIRRGESDEESVETARRIIERGGTVCIFPEGTRIRSGSLAEPKRGVGRLALETGAPVLPTAVVGSEHVRRGWRIRPRKVKVRLGRAIRFPRATEPSQALAEEVTARIWPSVLLQWEAMGGLPPMRRAAVIGAGSWGTAVAVLLARGGLEVQLGTRTVEQAEEVAVERFNNRYLEDVELPESIDVRPASEIELAGLDLLCLAIPSSSLPQAVGAIGDRISDRSSVLLLTKGLIAPQGMLPSQYVGERVHARAIACLGGPAHAGEAVSGSAALVLGSADGDLRQQLGEVFDRAGLVCERSGDVTGVEMAGAAKNAAVLAAAATEPYGRNAAGIAAAEIWRECIEYADALGAERETFTGLAGVGDLTATLMAPNGRNRRAGELLGEGTPADEIPDLIGQASEGLDTVPLLANAVAASGGPAEALTGLAALIEGEIDGDEWVAGLHQVEQARRAETDSDYPRTGARLGG
ncbi:MAG TPA: 1-acyl-sn-glycerol-3-phosphate acyltransferase [Solirubrobacterales bacterium]|jgi:glycerol-3-phosphate dehydrogenase (NAD(P)+)|nr:1-acyl-sn-glycerol-3-phosphate acyltransferase [Solirubrobacterales bacterium]